jgi:hypothetical protein
MSKIYVDEIAGIANANTVSIPGHVIQVVSNSAVSSHISTTNASFVDSGLSESITPVSASSKIVVMFHAGMGLTQTANVALQTKIYRGTTSVTPGTYGNYYFSGAGNMYNGYSHIITDSPNTTNEVTYKLYFCSATSGSIVYATHVDSHYSWTLMEIAG